MSWTPAELPGRLVMLDAEAITGLSDGQRLQTWSDGVNSFTQPQESARPRYIASGQGGRPVVRFNAELLTTVSLAAQPVRTALIVYSDASTQQWATPFNNVGDNILFHGNADDTSILGQQYGVGEWRTGLVRKNGSVIADRITPRPDAMGVFVFVASAAVGAAVQSIGADTGDASRAINGDIAFLWIGNEPLTLDDIQKFEGWAAHRRDLASALPADHPYKAAPPGGAAGPAARLNRTFAWL